MIFSACDFRTRSGSRIHSTFIASHSRASQPSTQSIDLASFCSVLSRSLWRRVWSASLGDSFDRFNELAQRPQMDSRPVWNLRLRRRCRQMVHRGMTETVDRDTCLCRQCDSSLAGAGELGVQRSIWSPGVGGCGSEPGWPVLPCLTYRAVVSCARLPNGGG